MQALWQDIRFACRTLAKSPGFTAVALLTLSLGIGANVAAFSMVRGVLLRPLPFPQPGQLVRVYDDFTASNTRDVGMSEPEWRDLKNRSGIFQEITPIWPISANLTGSEKPQRIEALATGTNYFTTLGAVPQLGRVYTEKEEVRGFIDAAVISNGFWRREFGSDPNVLGKKVRLDGDLYTIVGVMPPDFRHPGRTLQTDVDLWIAAGYEAAPFPDPPIRLVRMFPSAYGRLKPGLTIAEAQARLDAFAEDLSRQYPTDYPATTGWKLLLVSVQSDLVGHVQAELYILFGAVGCVLLIACGNLANLLLARGTARQREVAIRLAMGASRGRLVAQLLTESAVLASGAGLFAVLTVFIFKRSLLALAPADFPRLSEVRIDPSVLFFAFGLSILTAVLFGIFPALRASKLDQVESLREGSHGSGSSRSQIRVSQFLVAAEIALSLVLLIGAGLLLRSFWQLLQVNPGFNPHGVVTTQLWMPIPNNPAADPYRAPDKRAEFHREVLRRVAQLPGVEMAAIGGASSLPMTRARNTFQFKIQGRPDDSEKTPTAEFASVTPDFFSVLQVPLKAGRAFNDGDRTDSQKVAVIDETLAERYWPGQNPIGTQIQTGPINLDMPWYTIVGVVASVRTDSLDLPSAPHIYLALFQNPPASAVIFLRTAANPASLEGAVREKVQSVDPGIPVFAVRSLDEVLSRSMADRRFALTILGAFAGVAVLLAAIGIYGVMSYTFSRRAHEFAVRVALGAQRSHILRTTLGEGITLVAVGLGVGLLGALVATRYLRSLLFSVNSADPLTFAAIAAFLAGVALLACLVPAERATRVDPLTALREE